MIIERLSHENFAEFEVLLERARKINKYQIIFNDYYSGKSFISKYLIRKNVKLIIDDKKCIGYIWSEMKCDKTTNIKDFFIEDSYIDKLNPNYMKIFNSDFVFYETFENEYSIKILKKLNLKRMRITNLLSYSGNLTEDMPLQNIYIKNYIAKRDSKLRCIIQNEIFKNENRTPLSIEDIYFDEKQNYFLENMSLFIKYKDEYAGYGQIIYSRGTYLIVNFGVIDKYRNKGIGSYLLKSLIRLCIKNKNQCPYVRVSSTNTPAKNLYKKLGFMDVGIISTWIYENTN